MNRQTVDNSHSSQLLQYTIQQSSCIIAQLQQHDLVPARVGSWTADTPPRYVSASQGPASYECTGWPPVGTHRCRREPNHHSALYYITLCMMPRCRCMYVCMYSYSVGELSTVNTQHNPTNHHHPHHHRLHHQHHHHC